VLFVVAGLFFGQNPKTSAALAANLRRMKGCRAIAG